MVATLATMEKSALNASPGTTRLIRTLVISNATQLLGVASVQSMGVKIVLRATISIKLEESV